MFSATAAAEIVEDLRQAESAQKRKFAIAAFGKSLRKEARYQLVWDAVGGPAELAKLMAEFSLQDVRAMCCWLGNTASARNARAERRSYLGELVKILYSNPGDDRPLQSLYQEIVPACHLELVEEWETERQVKWTYRQKMRLFRGHRERAEKKLLEEMFLPIQGHEVTWFMFGSNRQFFRGDPEFCEEILTTLASKRGNVRIPDDFKDEFVMPLLNGLLKRRSSEELRNRFLRLVIECFEQHSEFRALDDEVGRTSALKKGVRQDYLPALERLPILSAKFYGWGAANSNVWEDSLLSHVIYRWYNSPTLDKEQVKMYLIRMIKLLPKGQSVSIVDMCNIVEWSHIRTIDREMRDELVRLLFRHTRGYELDLDDEPAAGLARLRDSPVADNLWPVELFFLGDRIKALRLFNKLREAHPSGDFLRLFRGGKNTVRHQNRDRGSNPRGDVEIVQALLIREAKAESLDPAWHSRMQALVQERQRKANQSRTQEDRSFWAQSAINLSVSVGCLDILRDTMLWARRFNKDPLTVIQLYGPSTIETAELEALLTSIPFCETAEEAIVSLEAASRNVEMANDILMILSETAGMGIVEPNSKQSYWECILRLPKTVIDLRMDRIKKLLKFSTPKLDSVMMRTVLKPTIIGLVRVEALLRETKHERLVGGSMGIQAPGGHVVRQLPNSAAAMLAELATFLFEEMRTRLGPERMKTRTWEVVDVVSRVARSDRPELACPFVRDLIMSDEDNSSWHRELISKGYLASLPARVAKELLHTMADAMKDKLREQNARPWPESDQKKAPGDAQPQQSVIKVTTIKMMAQLLQGNLFINSTSTVNILTGLLSETRHIDAHMALVSSLLSTLREPTCPTELRTRILNAIEEFTVPVAAQLSDRRSLTEGDWKAAEQEGGLLPEVGTGMELLGRLVEEAKKISLTIEDQERLAGLFMRVLQQSAVNNHRWMKLFLAKNNFHLTDDERLPVVPSDINMIVSIFSDWMNYMPASIFHMLQATALANLDPSSSITTITEAVRANADLVNSNGGKHWIDQFDYDKVTANKFGLPAITSALQDPIGKVDSKLRDGAGITISALQDYVVLVAESLLAHRKNDITKNLVTMLCRNRFIGREHWDSWQQNAVPVISDIVAHADEMRRRRKQECTKDRQTKKMGALPNTFYFQVMMLPFPFASEAEPSTFDDLNVFVSKVSDLIGNLASRRFPYHEDFVCLKNEIRRAPRTADYVRFALSLAGLVNLDGEEELELSDYLKLELAGHLSVKASDPADEGVVDRSRRMISDWVSCDDQRVQIIGASVEEALKKQGKNGWYVR